MHSTMHLYQINGAVQRTGRSETAFSYRDTNFAEVIVGVDPGPCNNERMIQWARDYGKVRLNVQHRALNWTSMVLSKTCWTILS